MLPKKDSFSFAQSTESDNNSRLFNIDVLCINCNEMINCEEIDSHSRLCNKVSKKVTLMENSNIIDQINFKIEKLLNSLEKLDFEMTNRNYKFYSKTRKEDLEALEQLKDLVKRIYIVNAINLDNIKLLKDYALKIHHIIKHFSGSPAILIYLERVKNLTKEKYQEMAQIDIKYIKAKNNEIPQNHTKKNPKAAPLTTIKEKDSAISVKYDDHRQLTSPKDRELSANKKVYFSDQKVDAPAPKKGKIFNGFGGGMTDFMYAYTEKSDNMSSQTPKTRIEIDKSSNASRSLATHENDRSPSKSNSKGVYHIDEINSDINNKRQGLNTSQGSVVQTEMSRQKSTPSHQGEPNDPFAFQSNSSRKKVDSDELQRTFYTKCLNSKMKFGSDSKVQRVSIALIYKEAMDKKVPQNEWNAFIENALKFPDKYLDLTKLKIRSTKKVLQNRLVEFSQDKQYKEKIMK